MIFNPASGRGRGEARIDRYLELLRDRLPGCEHAETTRAGEEEGLAYRAAQEGYDLVVAVGGDGTWSHVASGLLEAAEQEGREPPRLGVLPSGTGNDFGRNLGLDYDDMERAVGALSSGSARAIDVGRVVTPCRPDRDPTAEPTPRHFLNVVGFGFDVAVIDAAAGARFLRGTPLYKITALQQLFRFSGVLVDASSDGFRRAGRHLMVTISNGRFFGGGFPIAPGATIEDGLLHGCFIGDAPALTRAKLFALAERGRHVGSERVTLHGAPRFSLAFEETPRFEIDGDVFVSTASTVEVELLRGALTLTGV